jgi:hypothetical protein
MLPAAVKAAIKLGMRAAEFPKNDGMTTGRWWQAVRRGATLTVLCLAGCAPGALPKQAGNPGAQEAESAPVQTRKTLGKTTQNVLELSAALEDGAVLAEMTIQSGGLEIAAEAYRTQIGKAGTIAVQQKMNFYQAEHGELPKTYGQFIAEIIGKGRPDGIQLPMLPYYQEWAYDTEARKLVVVEFPAKKQQRQKQTTGAAGL